MNRLHTLALFAACSAALLLCLPRFATAEEAARPVLRVLNWSRYMDMDPEPDPSAEEQRPLAHRSPTLRAFMEKFGCEVVYDEYNTEEEMAKKISNLPGYYDVVFATRVKSEEMARAGLTAPLPKSRVPNLENIIPKYACSHNSGETPHFAPYMVGTTGLVYREDLLGRKADGWNDYFHPPQQFKGKIAAMDTSYMLYFGMLALGYDPDSRDPEQIRRSARLFLDLKREGFLTVFSSDYDTLAEGLQSGKLAMAVMYSGDALSASRGNSEIKYIIPEKGGEYYVDGMNLLKQARSPRLGAAFINYILNPEVNARLAVFLNYASPIRGARELILKADPSRRDNPSVDIPPEVMKRLRIFTNTDAEEIRRIWRKVMK